MRYANMYTMLLVRVYSPAPVIENMGTEQPCHPAIVVFIKNGITPFLSQESI